MLILYAIVTILFVNLVRYLELHDLTNVYNWKDYWKYSNGIAYSYNFVLILITIIFLIINKHL